MKLSIIIPAYNEEKTISTLIQRVIAVNLKDIEKEIIIVDDASTDSTLEQIRKFKNIKLLVHEHNQGKGSAIRTALKISTGDIILIQDADLEYNPKDYSKLLEPIISGEQYVVYGSRFLGRTFQELTVNHTKLRLHYAGNKFLSYLTKALYGINITDMETCYKLFKKEVLANISLKAKRFDFEPEITAKIIKAGYKIYEVPISYKVRSYEEGKKITVLDGIKALYYLIKYKIMD